MDGNHERDLNALAQYSRQAFDPTWAKTARGFRIGTFRDRYGQECSIQESSLAGEYAIWFGVDPCRMHLTYEQVRGLHHVLTDFLADSNLRAQFGDERVDPEAEDGGRRRLSARSSEAARLEPGPAGRREGDTWLE